MAEETASRALILLAVRNGAAYLPAQLDSYAAQTFRDWDLLAGDDGSTDDSRAVLARFAKSRTAHGQRVTVVNGPQTGGTAHFITLLGKAPDTARWIAFSDQDDVWLPEKLTRAVETLAPVPDDRPALYCSRTWVTGPDLENPRLSPDWHHPLTFRNALVQNIASGNTIVLNSAAVRLARRAAPGALAVPNLPAHDWWLYQIVTGAGGQILHDPRPGLFYRQHDGNQIGANRGLLAALIRARAILRGGYAAWNSANIAALRGAGTLTAENAAILETFAALRGHPATARLRALRRLGLYRQTRVTQTAFWLAAILGRL